jgi:membrane protease YdiL (CAAX protease family)
MDGAMFFAKAHQGRNGWWRWLLTITGTLTVWLIGHAPILAFIQMETERLGLGEQAFFGGTFPAGVDQNVYFLLVLIPFALAFVAMWLLIRLLHRKPLVAVMTGRPRFDWRRAFLAYALILALSVIGAFVIMPVSAYTYQFDPERFLLLLLMALFLLPLQTTFEELFFRGYLMQGFYLLLKSRMAALIVVTGAFVLIHIANPEFNRDYLVGATLYITISVLLGLSAVLDDGLEIPCGMHAANNFFLVAILSPADGSFATYALYTTELPVLMMYSPWLDIALAVVAFSTLASIYGWRLSRLREPVSPPAEQV